MRKEDTCQILPVSASQAHLRERDETPHSPHCFQFQIYHSHVLPACHNCTSRPYWNFSLHIGKKRFSKLLASWANYSASRINTYQSSFNHIRRNVHNDSTFFFSESWLFLVTWVAWPKFNFMQMSISKCYTATTNCRSATYGWHQNALVTSSDFIAVSLNGC